MDTASIARLEEIYYQSGKWRCKPSPTGAHHWVKQHDAKGGYGVFQCKWCKDVCIRAIVWDTLEEEVELELALLSRKRGRRKKEEVNNGILQQMWKGNDR